MPPTKAQLTGAIEAIEPEVREQLGARWAEFEPGLRTAVARIDAAEDDGQLRTAWALLLVHFSRFPAAHAVLRPVLDEIMDKPATHGDNLRYANDPAARVARAVDIAHPKTVSADVGSFEVKVALVLPDSGGEADRRVLSELSRDPVRVRLVAEAFDVLAPAEQQIILRDERDSLPVSFRLRPLAVGHGSITAEFYQNTHALAPTTVWVEVTPRRVDTVHTHTAGRALTMAPLVPPPDRVLHIRCVRESTSQVLVFELRDPHRHLEVGKVLLEAEPQVHAERLYRSLVALAGCGGVGVAAGGELGLSTEEPDRRIRQLGHYLYKTLIPPELKELYEDERTQWRNTSMLIKSDEPYFPWEMIWPYSAGRWQDDEPWCLSMKLTRWLFRDARGNGHPEAPMVINLRRLACIAPLHDDLPAAQEERRFLAGLAARGLVQDVSPRGNAVADLMRLLEAGGYDCLHLASHGTFYQRTPATDSLIHLGEDDAVSPDRIVGCNIEGHILRARPAFFINACHSGRQGYGLTRLGGWANALISAGAGMVVAPQWTVDDRQALAFARALYTELLAGKMVADAARDARRAARVPGDPTWLAYAVYAHTGAVVPAQQHMEAPGPP